MADNSVPQGAEMGQLQQEAIRRAREMQARAQIPVNYPPFEPAAPSPPAPEPTPAPPPDDSAPHPNVEQMPVHPRQENRQPQNRRPEPGGAASSLNGTLDFLTRDPERAMVLLLMLILMEEKADNSLLFAMMYLLS